MSKRDFGRRPIGYRKIISSLPRESWLKRLLRENEDLRGTQEPEYRPDVRSEFRKELEKRR